MLQKYQSTGDLGFIPFSANPDLMLTAKSQQWAHCIYSVLGNFDIQIVPFSTFYNISNLKLQYSPQLPLL